jgi:hypothetical protein
MITVNMHEAKTRLPGLHARPLRCVLFTVIHSTA